MHINKLVIVVLLALFALFSCNKAGDKDEYLLENEFLKVQVSNDLSINIENKINNVKYSMLKPSGFLLQSVDVTNDKSLFHCNYLSDSIDITISISLRDSTINFELIADSLTELTDRLCFPGSISTNNNDYFVIPYATGLLLPVDEEPFTDEFCFWQHGSTMSFVGVTNMKSSYMVISDDPWDTGVLFDTSANGSHYRVNLFHEPSKKIFSYNRSFHYTFFAKGSYVEMAKNYRAFADNKGYAKTFGEKALENPNINKLKGALNFWLMDKEFKTPDFINQLNNFGIEKAVFSLAGGWYMRENLSNLIDTINTKGYLSGRYDLLTDVWPPTHKELKQYRTSGFPDEVVVDVNDSLFKGWVSYIGDDTPFQGYIICSQTHADYLDNRLAKELPNNHFNTRFIDVELSLPLIECYSDNHPLTRHQDALNRINALGVVSNKYKLVSGSEEAFDWAFPVTDYSEGTMSVAPDGNSGYNWANPIDDPDEHFLKYNLNPTLRIPLHGLVYHDVHIPVWYTGDGQSKVPAYWDDKDAFNILYASMQLFMPPDYSYWMNNREKYITSYHLAGSVLEGVGFAKMTGHKFITDDMMVQQTSFDNGWTCTVNFNDVGYDYNDRVLSAKGFCASNDTSRVYKIIKDGGNIAVAELPRKLFINPYGKTVSIDGVRTSGAIVLLKHDNYIQVAFIGDQKSIEINPDSLPWNVSELKVTTDDFKEVTLFTTDNNWFKIERVGDNRFYRINIQNN